MIANRMTGPYGSLYWALIVCNVLTPQLLWFKRVRTNVAAAVRHLADRQHRHVAGALRHHRHHLHRDFLPSSWGMYYADDLGLGHVRRHDRAVPHAAVPVPPLPADDLDLRDADAGAGGASRRSTPMKPSGRTAGSTGCWPSSTRRTRSSTAARRAHDAGYRKMDAYTPLPDRGADRRSAHARQPAAAGRAGRRHPRRRWAATSLQYWVSTVAYPLNVGGRPLHSWPTFIPVTFETTILAAALRRCSACWR